MRPSKKISNSVLPQTQIIKIPVTKGLGFLSSVLSQIARRQCGYSKHFQMLTFLFKLLFPDRIIQQVFCFRQNKLKTSASIFVGQWVKKVKKEQVEVAKASLDVNIVQQLLKKTCVVLSRNTVSWFIQVRCLIFKKAKVSCIYWNKTHPMNLHYSYNQLEKTEVVSSSISQAFRFLDHQYTTIHHSDLLLIGCINFSLKPSDISTSWRGLQDTGFVFSPLKILSSCISQHETPLSQMTNQDRNDKSITLYLRNGRPRKYSYPEK